VHEKGADNAFKRFVEDKLEVLAGLKPRLVTDRDKLPGSRILDGWGPAGGWCTERPA
jgi:polar amino acid transport system substrate-binding protein